MEQVEVKSPGRGTGPCWSRFAFSDKRKRGRYDYASVISRVQRVYQASILGYSHCFGHRVTSGKPSSSSFREFTNMYVNLASQFPKISKNKNGLRRHRLVEIKHLKMLFAAIQPPCAICILSLEKTMVASVCRSSVSRLCMPNFVFGWKPWNTPVPCCQRPSSHVFLAEWFGLGVSLHHSTDITYITPLISYLDIS